MIEADNQEIDVEKLMYKIKDEVARSKGLLPSANLELSTGRATRLVDVTYIEALLNNAEFKSQVRTHWPDKFNRFPFNLGRGLQKFALKVYNFLFKEQRAVNFSLLQALRESLALNRQLSEQITALQTQLKGLNERLNATNERLQGVGERQIATDERLQGVGERLVATDQRLTTAITATDQRLTTAITATDQRLTTAITATDQHLNAITATDQRLTTAITATDQHLNAIDERYIRNDSYLKNDLAQQKRLIALFLEEARQRFPEPFNQQQLQSFINEEQHFLDAFYVAFEEEFRGSREEIINRLKVYLPLIEEAKVGTPELPILDVGCGRGEWLELLRDSGYAARGLDVNRVILEQCRSRKIDVIESDVIAYLKSLPDATIGVVTGFHIVEHLPFEVIIHLFDESLRVLKPGGIIIFETPNPQNVLTGSCNFYFDPTHRNPIPSPTLKFIAENRGFCQVKTLPLHPYPDTYKIKGDGSQLEDRFNRYFYGEQDYAVIGFKS
jgi:O-antigen chain-terminating methyltransferase